MIMLHHFIFNITHPYAAYFSIRQKTYRFSTYLLTLITILFIGVLTHAWPLYQSLQQDVRQIHDQLPTFSITDNTLSSTHDSYVYLTDSLIFYFDPQNKVPSDMIETEHRLHQAPISVGLLHDHFTIQIANNARHIAYSELALDENTINQILVSIYTNNLTTVLLALVMTFIVTGIVFILDLIPIIIINHISVMFQKEWSLKHSASLTLTTLTIPVIFSSITTAIGWDIPYQFHVFTAFSMILFYVNLHNSQHT